MKILLWSLLKRQGEKRLQWSRFGRDLDRMTTLEEFDRYVAATNPSDFLFYEKASLGKRQEIQLVLDTLGIDVSGKAALDIGPGYGDALDEFHQRGARDVAFIEYDPFFFTLNRLKEFTRGYRANHLRKLTLFEADAFDFIWIKGSIREDLFMGVFGWLFSLPKWLKKVRRILAPGGTVVLCPYWSSSGDQRLVQDARHSSFTETILDQGYDVLPHLDGHNTEPNYPITFILKD